MTERVFTAWAPSLDRRRRSGRVAPEIFLVDGIEGPVMAEGLGGRELSKLTVFWNIIVRIGVQGG